MAGNPAPVFNIRLSEENLVKLQAIVDEAINRLIDDDGWIDVREGLPVDGQGVTICQLDGNSDPFISLGIVFRCVPGGDVWESNDGLFRVNAESITHWRSSVPDLPKKFIKGESKADGR